MKRLIPIVIAGGIISCSSLKGNRSRLDAGDSDSRTLIIFKDSAMNGLDLKVWSADPATLSQAVVAAPNHGAVWEMENKADNPGVIYAQYRAGKKSISSFKDGTLKFDLRRLDTGTQALDAIVKVGGIYPARGEHRFAISAINADSQKKLLTPECLARLPVIEGAAKAGELAILRNSSDTFMGQCIDAMASSWQEFSVPLNQLDLISGFSLDAVLDQFVLELAKPGKIQVDNIRIEMAANAPTPQPTANPGPTAPVPVPATTDLPVDKGPAVLAGKIQSYADIGSRSNAKLIDNVAVTEGVIRVRRRHENDMDFAKFNPFYWEGRLTQFKVEDFTSKGENRLKFSLVTEWPQDNTVNRGPDFSAIYVGNPDFSDETLRSKFAVNARMTRVGTDDRHFTMELRPEDFAAHADQLKKGAMLMFEFRFFLAESNPDWQRQKARNPHNISAYYSEFFRIRVGEPGLLIEKLGDSSALPDPQQFNGGWSTLPMAKAEPWKALQQQALNLTFENAQKFLNGRTWFHTDFATGKHVGDTSDDKPSIFFEDMEAARQGLASDAFNVTSCNSCHINNGISLLPTDNRAITGTVVKTLNKSSGEAHAQFGGQLQSQGAGSEGLLKIQSFDRSTATLADGTTVALRKPIFVIENASFATDDLALSPRRTPPILGMGLLDAVSDDTIRSLAAGSKGEVSIVNGRVARFGWKAGQISVRDQIMAALRNDMGVMSQGQPTLDCRNNCKPGKSQIPATAIDEMEAYISLLGVPARNNPNSALVRQGEQVFQRLACQTCHVMTLRTGNSKFSELSNQTIQPFTDLLLHDMGDGLADSNSGATARKWRTAPLWGIKNVRHSTDAHIQQFPAGKMDFSWKDSHAAADTNKIEFLHDGRAQSLPEAILWHGGEAKPQADGYKALSQQDRAALESFLWDL